jgi:RNA polymerase sigma-70 factor, ECF subfamily
MDEEAMADGDLALIDALMVDKDERAFRELYRRHTPRLYQFVLRLLGGSEADAQDVVQQSWVIAVERVAQFRREARFDSWLLGIGLNMARTLLRTRGRWDELGAAPEPATAAVSCSERIDLERAIAMLPDGYRILLVLHDVEGYTHEDIAHQLGISPGTSKSQLSRARRTMRKLLGHQYQED